MDSNNNRLYLNFDNQRPAANDRAYPTTPSTFPQPVFPPSAGAQPGSMQQSQQQQQYGAGYPPQGGYFAQNQYGQQYPGQAVTSDYPNAYPPQPGAPGTNDPNTGLAHQFSHQNLGGGASRGGQYAGRGPSSGRPRTAGGSGQQGSHGYVPPVPSQGAASSPEFQPIPERNPDKYGTNANSNQKKCSQLAADFFKDSVKRARERNQRYGRP